MEIVLSTRNRSKIEQIKAVFGQKQTDKWCIADDTGLFIDALGGQPGIYAARWAGKDVTTEFTRDFTLKKLEGVSLPKRTATFETVAAVVSPIGEHKFFSGKIKGKILLQPRTECQPNMPYSGIFMPDGYDKVWAEMGVEEENKISHRGKAFRQVRDFFAEMLL